jgi:hypothetical protein
MSAADVLTRWEGQDLIPLPDLAHEVGLNRGTLHYARKTGAIIPDPTRRGRNGRHMITWEQALLIVAAAALAAAAGIALVTALHALRGAGAQVANGGVMIPLGAAA